MQGEGKKGDFFPHTQLGTGSKGLEVSGFPTNRRPTGKVFQHLNNQAQMGLNHEKNRVKTLETLSL